MLQFLEQEATDVLSEKGRRSPGHGRVAGHLGRVGHDPQARRQPLRRPFRILRRV